MLTKDVNGELASYNYNEVNQLTAKTIKEQTIDYIYDQNGDLIEKSTGEKYTYDIQGNLTSIKGNGINKAYTYNGTGQRLSETSDNETIYYVNDLNQSFEQILQIYNEDGIIDTFTYGLQRIDSKGETAETYLYDGRGSVTGIVGANNEFASYRYTAYGELMPNSPQPKVFGYNAEQTDFNIGIQYLRARYYDVTINRFFQEDDYKGKYTNPMSMNRYIYTEGNPVTGIDPSGYGVIDDYKYQMTQKSNQARSSNFYTEYYSNKAKQPEPEVREVHNTAEYYQYMYGKEKPKVQYNDNGKVLVKNPFAEGPAYVTIEEYNCLRDGKDLYDNLENEETVEEEINEDIDSQYIPWIPAFGPYKYFIDPPTASNNYTTHIHTTDGKMQYNPETESGSYHHTGSKYQGKMPSKLRNWLKKKGVWPPKTKGKKKNKNKDTAKKFLQ